MPYGASRVARPSSFDHRVQARTNHALAAIDAEGHAAATGGLTRIGPFTALRSVASCKAHQHHGSASTLTSPAAHPRSSRATLAAIWLASIAVLLAVLGAMALDTAMPVCGPTAAMRRPVVVGLVDDLPRAAGEPLAIAGERAFLVGGEDGWVALSSVSTHRRCIVDWKSDQGVFIDPCHGSFFARDGRWIKGPRYQTLDLPEGTRDRDGNVITDAGVKGLEAPRDMDRMPLVALDTAGDMLLDGRADGTLPSVPALPGDARVIVDAGRRIVGTTR